MTGLNRRDFLRALGLTGSASALAACGLDDNRYKTPIEQLLPYVVKPEVHTPGTPTFYATTITSGPSAFPVVARHREGRVVMVGANKRAPGAHAIPRPALLELQRMYSPDRFTGPRQREGSSWSDVDWDAGMKRLSDAVSAANAAGKAVVYLGPYRSGAITELLEDYTRGRAVYWEPLGRDAEAEAAQAVFGTRMLPAYDLSNAKYILSFGADFLGSWGTPDLAAQYAAARDPNRGRIARFGAVTPRLDQTAANADDWYACKPGSEALVARAIAKLVAKKKAYSGPALVLLESASPGEAASASGIAEADLDAIASQIAATTSVALPGGVSGAGRAATDLAAAVYLLNVVSGAAGTTFGAGPAYYAPIHGFSAISDLVTEMTSGKVGVLLIDDVNPAYALPKTLKFAEALGAVDLVVGLSSHPNETNALVNLILPTSAPLEDWGDEDPNAALHLVRQPAMTALNDTRSLGDVLLVSARAAGLTPMRLPTVEPAPADAAAPVDGATDAPVVAAGPQPLGFTSPTWREYVKSRWERDIYPLVGTSVRFEFWWVDTLQDGFVAIPGRAAIIAPQVATTVYPFESAAAYGEGGDLFLHVYPQAFRFDGRYANEPWAQECADPMTGQTWDSWVEISKATAARLGVADNDLVEVKTAAGTVSLGVQVYPGLRDDTIAIAFGQGHTALGRYADGYGVNAVDLLAVVQGAGGAFAWQQTMAAVRPLGVKANLTGIVGHAALDGRPYAPIIDAAELAKVGDAADPHPGHLTGIHEAPWDPRLVEEGVDAFFQEPDHPHYRWALTVDTNACNGCGACVVACYAENNLPVVGKDLIRRGKEMNWLRINRYWEVDAAGQPDARFLPMMCQQCSHAPCESVCPVLATYHTLEGLNAMVYNRCVGTRYCANNCPYQARRFNFHSFKWPEPLQLQLNPDATVRTMGVMEKCTFCVQRIRHVKSAVRDHDRSATIPDSELRKLTACAEACPTDALVFGNLLDPASKPATSRQSARSYILLEELWTKPGVNYLARASFHAPAPHAATDEPAHAPASGEHHG